ncbi:MAG: hypothetical protein Q8K63_06885 [Acidimicrobiales bacterium]|nr:hypothetical protein [Acidimicrobiales bacterium]
MTAVWRASLIVTTAAVTGAALGGCQRSEAAPPPISAVMHVVNSRPIVDAEVINADGEAHRVRLLVDTTGAGLVFTSGAAKRAKLEVGKRKRRDDGLFSFVDAKAVRVGKTRLELGGAEPLVAIDTDRDVLEGVDGSIGVDVLQRYGRVTMNFPTERIVLGEPDSVPVLGARVPVQFDDGLITGRVTLGSATHRLRVATGAVTTHIRERVSIRVTGTRQGVWGKIVLAPFEVVSDPEVRTDGDGLLGANLLARYTVRIDFARETFRISTT